VFFFCQVSRPHSVQTIHIRLMKRSICSKSIFHSLHTSTASIGTTLLLFYVLLSSLHPFNLWDSHRITHVLQCYYVRATLTDYKLKAVWQNIWRGPTSFSHTRVRTHSSSVIILLYFGLKGQAVAQWLRHCATNRKVAESIPDSVIGIFYWHNSFGCTMTLGIFPGVKGGRCLGLTTLPPSCADCLKTWEPQLAGTPRACPGL
jgi:hypothetical protein